MKPTPSLPFFIDPLAGKTLFHPLIAAFVILLCIAMIMAPRKYAVVWFILAQNFITNGQRLSLGGTNFQVMRIMICVAIIRIILRRENSFLKGILLDKIVVWYGVASTLAYTILRGTSGAFAYAMGSTLDSVGAYFVIRTLVRDEEDLRLLVTALVISSLALVPLFFTEKKSGNNPFAAFGGVPLLSEVREGRIRAQGPYSHSLLAGSYWAAAVPLFLRQLMLDRKGKAGLLLAIAASLLIIQLCAGSTPVLSLLAGLGATLLYYQRASLPTIKIAFLAGLVVLSLVMSHPIWFLFSKIDIAGGSTGFFRYLLIDAFIKNWSEWLLFGVRDTIHWGRDLGLPAAGLGDITNQFIAEAVRGGAASLVLFIAGIVIVFGYLGELITSTGEENEKKGYWQLAVCLVVHIFNYFGVSYFGQVRFSWWMTLAICGSFYQAKFGALPAPIGSREPRLTLLRQGNIQ